MCYEQKEDRNGVVMGEEDGMQAVTDGVSNVNNGISGEAIRCVENGLQVSQQQQSQNSVICWERFLPTRSLKVLLVENDFSTRQLVGALLRNCSYEVTAVGNGLQAWKILEDLNNHIDLILTEVAMPILSGIGLLSKIMSHKTFKNIPVIMMSSHDSMGIVFKCLSKGAVDFLVKPIRKNELKNLWQHVWRRCHSSSGSGSESGTHPRKYANSKSNEESENNSDGSDELGEYASHGSILRDGSDNGSGTQSSWTKRAADFDSPQPMSPSYQLADGPDSTCAQVIHTKPEMTFDRRVHITDKKDQGKAEQIDDFAVGKDSEIGVSRDPDFQSETHCENVASCPSGKRLKILCEVDSKPLENGQLERICENIKHGDQVPETMSADINISQPSESKNFDGSNICSNISQIKDKACFDFVELPSVELTLERHKGVGDGGSGTNDDQNVLRHSDLSAFSKYHTVFSANQGLTGKAGSSSPVDHSSVAMKTDTVINDLFHSSGALLNQQSNGSSNNNDMASTAKNVTPKLDIWTDKSESTSALNSFHSSAFKPVQTGCTGSHQHMKPGVLEGLVANTHQEQCKDSHQQVQVQLHHHHHHHHYYHHHIGSVQQYQSQLDHDDLSMKNVAAVAPQCGSSNVVGGQTEGNAGNYSMNGSASGSNHGSNGQNGSSPALNAEPTNVGSDNIAVGNSEAGGISGKIGKNAIDEDRIAIREAALSKFRQKRKERCFEKRVRYQSRKRLAEQRPRVKGQFVRQTASDNRAETESQSNDHTSEDNSCDSLR